MVKYRAPASINHKLTHKTTSGHFTMFSVCVSREGMSAPPIEAHRAHLHLRFPHNSRRGARTSWLKIEQVDLKAAALVRRKMHMTQHLSECPSQMCQPGQVRSQKQGGANAWEALQHTLGTLSPCWVAQRASAKLKTSTWQGGTCHCEIHFAPYLQAQGEQYRLPF